MRKRQKPKRVKWTYEAELDYVVESSRKKGEWVVGFLDDEGNPYECPITTDVKLINKLEELDTKGLTNRLRVTVELNENMDRFHRQYPALIDVDVIKNDETE